MAKQPQTENKKEKANDKELFRKMLKIFVMMTDRHYDEIFKGRRS